MTYEVEIIFPVFDTNALATMEEGDGLIADLAYDLGGSLIGSGMLLGARPAIRYIHFRFYEIDAAEIFKIEVKQIEPCLEYIKRVDTISLYMEGIEDG